MRKLDTEKYRQLLLDEKGRLHENMEGLEVSITQGDTQTGLSELANYDQHPGDAGTETFEKEKDQALLDAWRDIIGKIDEALGKMDRGTYGTCDRCGRDISEPRLEAVPHAIFCVECQDIVEGS